ncbi:MAG TPA: glutathione S-transferase family protein [Kofleriaceae bacterium]|nr:glutathione S-transferase family protein [Kofleriaceae bacterium]
MLTLHQTPPAWDLPNVSPFCLKLETYLRMTGRPYQTASPSLRRAPKGKVPYIADGDVLLGDSGFIIDHLVRTYGDPLDGDLTAEARARGHVLRRMIEEHCYFTIVYLRWSFAPAWPHLVEAFAPLMPPLLKTQGPKLIRRAILKKCQAQGVGKHTREEVLVMMKDDLAALDAMLGDQPFYLGDAPRSVDATAYGFLSQVLWAPWQSAEKELLLARPRLVAHLERMKERFWAGWSAIAAARSAA